MSQFPPAFAFLIQWEDPLRLWAVEPDACSEGKPGPCFAISGINSSDWPEEFAAIRAIPQNQRGSAIISFYQYKFWTPMKVGGIDSQDLANRVMDEGVWSGPGTAVIMLQKAVNTLQGASVTALATDGVLGPETLAAVNGAAEDSIVAAYRQERLRYVMSTPMYKSASVDDRVSYLKRASE